jgi:hypothetical protein
VEQAVLRLFGVNQKEIEDDTVNAALLAVVTDAGKN